MKTTPLKRHKPLCSREDGLTRSSGLHRKAVPARRKTFTPASKAQREKARSEPCIVTGEEAIYGAVIHPAHLCARAKGGCDDPRCIVPLRADLHRLFDDGKLDLLPYLVGRRVPELQHALGHYEGDVVGLLNRLSGAAYVLREAV